MAITCSTAGYLQVNSAMGADFAGGYLEFCWLYQTVLALHSIIISGNSNTSVNSSLNTRVAASGAGAVNATSNAAGNSTSTTVNVLSINTWSSVAGVYLANNNRRCYLNGDTANAGSNIVNPAMDSPISWTRVGGRFGNSQAVNTASMCEISRWNISGFSQSDCESLIAKLNTLVSGSIENPRNINMEIGQVWTGKLISYHPFTTVTDLTCAHTGGFTFSATSSGGQPATSAVSHPNVVAFQNYQLKRKLHYYRQVGGMAA